MNEKRTYQLTVKTGYITVAVSLIALGALFVGVTGIYFGSLQQERKDASEVLALRHDLAAQQLRYEQRLGEQSARYALEAGASVQSLNALWEVIASIQKQNDKATKDREAAMQRAISAAQAAQAEAKAARERIAELSVQTQATNVIAQNAASAATAAASTAKETQRTLDNATLPAAVVPHHKWGDGK